MCEFVCARVAELCFGGRWRLCWRPALLVTMMDGYVHVYVYTYVYVYVYVGVSDHIASFEH